MSPVFGPRPASKAAETTELLRQPNMKLAGGIMPLIVSLCLNLEAGADLASLLLHIAEPIANTIHPSLHGGETAKHPEYTVSAFLDFYLPIVLSLFS